MVEKCGTKGESRMKLAAWTSSKGLWPHCKISRLMLGFVQTMPRKFEGLVQGLFRQRSDKAPQEIVATRRDKKLWRQGATRRNRKLWLGHAYAIN